MATDTTKVTAGSVADLASKKEIVRRCLEAIERGTLDEVRACWAPDAINHASGRPGQHPPSGPEGIAQVVRQLRTAFPDRRWQVDEMIAEGDLVACRVTVGGTFGTKPEQPPFPVPTTWVGVEGTALAGPSATGRPYSVKQIHIFRVSNGMIAEHWAARDDLGLLLQVGAIAVSDE